MWSGEIFTAHLLGLSTLQPLALAFSHSFSLLAPSRMQAIPHSGPIGARYLDWCLHSKNVPTGGSAALGIVRNPLCITITKMVISSLLLPALARWLASLDGSWRQFLDRGIHKVRNHQRRTKTQLLVMLGILFADVMSTILFDESWSNQFCCVRLTRALLQFEIRFTVCWWHQRCTRPVGLGQHW